jgi:excisionase family DNA binding protein
LTEAEAARLLHIHPRTLRKNRAYGHLPCVRIGKCVRYQVADIEAFIARSVVVNDDPVPIRQSAPTTKRAAPGDAITPLSKLIG